MDIMKPIASKHIPQGDEWFYEVKYDGFRCVLVWEKEEIRLISKNNKDLTDKFPEIIAGCKRIEKDIAPYLPLQLDGELVVLNNPIQANFAWIQKRGRLRRPDFIQKAAASRPASYMAFDLLQLNGINMRSQELFIRKNKLHTLFASIKSEQKEHPLHYVFPYEHPDDLWRELFVHKGEGIIAKRRKSKYLFAKQHHDWFKIKNWRTIHGIVTAYHPTNGYFSIQVYDAEGKLKNIGKCKHQLEAQAKQTLTELFLTNGTYNENYYTLPPAICTTIHTLDLYEEELREPEFVELLPHDDATNYTADRVQLEQAMLPDDIDYVKLDKLYWPKPAYTKGDLLVYMREIAPYMLPFLKNRALTVIRCPEGVEEASFFQKHLPNYAPDFIEHVPNEAGTENLILCNNLETLIWFSNHGALEYHVPFQTVATSTPEEIVFDLDPPDRNHFSLAVFAATLIKQMLDGLKLQSFVKLSGNKGLQIYIPIPTGSMTYDETAVFTQAIAWTLEQQYPDSFTTERLKKNRNNRLYIDYVQHGKDKTIIAPYSPRRTDDGTIAMPLFWDEINDTLHPAQFTIKNGVKRMQELGCPFATYHQVKEKQILTNLRAFI